MKQQIAEFITGTWFPQFDVLAEEEKFLPWLAEDVRMFFPEGEFVGHAGFHRWYDGVKKMIAPNNVHTITDIMVNDSGKNRFSVTFTSNVVGETPQGEPLKILVTEQWNGVLVAGKIQITEYRVLPKEA